VTAATLSWLDLTASDRNRMRQVPGLFQERGTVDEGGFSRVATGRVLPFGLAASRAYGDLMAAARATGRSLSVSGGYIAAIAVANAMLVATRDIAPFRDAGLETINPGTSGG